MSSAVISASKFRVVHSCGCCRPVGDVGAVSLQVGVAEDGNCSGVGLPSSCRVSDVVACVSSSDDGSPSSCFCMVVVDCSVGGLPSCRLMSDVVGWYCCIGIPSE